MNRNFAFLGILTIAAAIAQVALGSLWIRFFADVDPDNSGALAFLYGPLSTLSGVLMPFALGYFVGRKGFLLGAVLGLISSPIELLLITNNLPSLWLLPQLLSSSLSGAISCAIACAAGTLARGLGANNSFKPTPLRGAA